VGEGKDFPRVLVALNRSARFTANPNDKEACFYVNLDELKGDTVLVRYEWQIALPAMERWRRLDNSSNGVTMNDSLNEFVARAAVAAAENDLADRRLFLLDESQWRKLQAELNRPAKPNSKLRKLLDNPSVLEQPR